MGKGIKKLFKAFLEGFSDRLPDVPLRKKKKQKLDHKDLKKTLHAAFEKARGKYTNIDEKATAFILSDEFSKSDGVKTRKDKSFIPQWGGQPLTSIILRFYFRYAAEEESALDEIYEEFRRDFKKGLKDRGTQKVAAIPSMEFMREHALHHMEGLEKFTHEAA